MLSTKSKTRQKFNGQFVFEAIGTHWVIDIFDKPQQPLSDLQKAITDRIGQFDLAYSRFRPDSLITKMSHEAGDHSLPDDAAALINFYQEMYLVTDGAVTPLIGKVVSDAGYDAKYSLIPTKLEKPPVWEEVISFDAPVLSLKQPALLDFGAAGKGYLVDIISELLEQKGIKEYCVDAGGDMRQNSPAGQSLRVGLEHPDNPKQVIGIVELANQSLCGSAGNRRKWANFHHIIDPNSLSSPTHIKAVWTVADSTLLADGMSTCLFFTDPEKLLTHFGFEYVIVYQDGSAAISSNFPGELFTKH